MTDTIETPTQAWTNPRIGAKESFDKFDRYTITADYDARADVHIEIAKVNKLIKRHGGEVRIVGEEIIEKAGYVPGRVVRKVIFTIEAPAVAGEKAKLAGAFELAEDGVSIYTAVVKPYTEEQVAPFKDRWQECDHCGYDRKRHASFVCEKLDGTFTLIGRNCSKAFLGLSPAELLARAAVAKVLDNAGDADEDGWGGGGGSNLIYMETLVDRAYRVALHLGGYSRYIKDKFLQHMWALGGAKDHYPDTTNRDIRREYEGKYTEKLNLVAFADYIDRATGDFGENLRVAFSCEYVKPKRVGLIIAGVGMFVGRALKLVEEAKNAKLKPPAKLLAGAEKDRVDFVAEVTKTIPFENDFGGGIMIIMMGADGENVIHYATGENTPDAGKRYAVRGTIKKQGTARFDGQPQTTITRATYKEVA